MTNTENCNYSFHILSFPTFSLWPCTESQDKKNPIFANLLMLRNCLATQGNSHERSWNGGLALGVVQAILQFFQTKTDFVSLFLNLQISYKGGLVKPYQHLLSHPNLFFFLTFFYLIFPFFFLVFFLKFSVLQVLEI